MSTRSKSQPQKATEAKVAQHKSCETKVFFVDRTLTEEVCQNVELIQLRNPCTDLASRYVFSKDKSIFFELLSFSEQPRCWFINDMTCSNGNLYVTFPFDPLFWAVYYLRKNSIDRCIPIDQAVIDDKFAQAHQIVGTLKAEQLAMIADQKGDPSLLAFKYNEEKTMKWLALKCRKLAQKLIEKNFHIGAKSMNFVKTEKFEDTKHVDSEMLSYAVGIVSEYIKPDLAEKLMSHLGLEKAKALASSNKRKSVVDSPTDQKDVKRIKTELLDESFDENKSDVGNVFAAKEKKISAKEKQLAKAASGTKSISSFFMKK